MLHIWIKAARLRTLPLSASGVILGGAVAASEGAFRPAVFALSVLTALLLQILSNFANDYGDYTHGSDGAGRVGPSRAVSSGEISPRSMFRAVAIFSCLSALSAAALFWTSFGTEPARWGTFAALGAASIAAALFYTMGRHPYGYNGLGDFFVFVFFGLVAVCGAYALYPEAPLARMPGLPACATGFFATAVLNVNNIRDMENDRASGKETLALRLGALGARRYHLALVGMGLLCWAVYLPGTDRYSLLPGLLAGLPLVWSAKTVFGSTRSDVLDAQLRRTSICAGLFNLIMAGLIVWRSGAYLAW